MFHHPLSLQGVYSSILYVNLNSKMQKSSNCVSTGKKNSTASLKNSTDVFAPSGVFPTMVSQPIHWAGHFVHLGEAFFIPLVLFFILGTIFFIPFPFPNFRKGQTWDLSKNLHDRIFGPKILHTESAYIVTIFTQKETAKTH